MIVNKLIKELQREARNGNGNLEVRQFAHDHNPEQHNEGTGATMTVDEYTNDLGDTFIGLCAS